MQLVKESLGKVSVTVDGLWDKNVCYDRLSIVLDVTTTPTKARTYISRKPVPEGIDIRDFEYWQPFSISGNLVVKCICKLDLDAMIDGDVDIPTKDWCGHDKYPSEDDCCCEALEDSEIIDITEGNFIADDDKDCGCDCVPLTVTNVSDILNGKQIIDNTGSSCCCTGISSNEIEDIVNGKEVSESDCACGCEALPIETISNVTN